MFELCTVEFYLNYYNATNQPQAWGLMLDSTDFVSFNHTASGVATFTKKAGISESHGPFIVANPSLFHKYRFIWTFSNVTFYIDDWIVATHGAQVPLTMMALFIDSVGSAVQVDYVQVAPAGGGYVYTATSTQTQTSTLWTTANATTTKMSTSTRWATQNATSTSFVTTSYVTSISTSRTTYTSVISAQSTLYTTTISLGTTIVQTVTAYQTTGTSILGYIYITITSWSIYPITSTVRTTSTETSTSTVATSTGVYYATYTSTIPTTSTETSYVHETLTHTVEEAAVTSTQQTGFTIPLFGANVPFPFDPVYLFGGGLAAVAGVGYFYFYRGGGKKSVSSIMNRLTARTRSAARSVTESLPDIPPLASLLGKPRPAAAPKSEGKSGSNPKAANCIVCGDLLPKDAKNCLCGAPVNLSSKGSIMEAEGRVSKLEQLL